jgi:hypothetical protein
MGEELHALANLLIFSSVGGLIAGVDTVEKEIETCSFFRIICSPARSLFTTLTELCAVPFGSAVAAEAERGVNCVRGCQQCVCVCVRACDTVLQRGLRAFLLQHAIRVNYHAQQASVFTMYCTVA